MKAQQIRLTLAAAAIFQPRQQNVIGVSYERAGTAQLSSPRHSLHIAPRNRLRPNVSETE